MLGRRASLAQGVARRTHRPRSARSEAARSRDPGAAAAGPTARASGRCAQMRTANYTHIARAALAPRPRRARAAAPVPVRDALAPAAPRRLQRRPRRRRPAAAFHGLAEGERPARGAALLPPAPDAPLAIWSGAAARRAAACLRFCACGPRPMSTSSTPSSSPFTRSRTRTIRRRARRR